MNFKTTINYKLSTINYKLSTINYKTSPGCKLNKFIIKMQ